MSYLFAILLTLIQATAPRPSAEEIPLPVLVDGVDRTFARMKDFSADFVQITENTLNRREQDTGHLYLMRPRMRWDYKTPQEKLLVSDGKMVYFYVPSERQVSRDQVRDALDARMPLMFLVGRSNLRGEFKEFATTGSQPVIQGTKSIRMVPRRQSELKELIMEVDAQFHVRRLVLTHSDGSRIDFRFSNIQTNKGLQPSLFEFKVPPGVKILEGIG